MKKLLTIVILFICATALAQNRHVDSTLVSLYPTSFDSIALTRPQYIDTATFHADIFDPLFLGNTVYTTLSNIGLAHHSMRFLFNNNLGFDLSLPAFSTYIKTDRDLKTYLSLLPYSEIRYYMTNGDKEQHLHFRFGRQIMQGLFLSFEYNNHYSPGVFNNNKADNNYFWINALYTTKNKRYGATAYWFRNKLEMQENGGIMYDSVYVNQQESDNSAILTNLNNATNYVKVSGAGFKHYFNLLPLYNKKEVAPKPDSLSIDTLRPLIPEQDSIHTLITHDSISTRKFTLGRINHSFAYQRNQLFYNETSASLPFYAPFDTLLHAKTTDSIVVQAYRNNVTWNSLGYQNYSDNVPFYVYAGINYDFYRIKHYNYIDDITINDRHYSQVIINGGIILNLFRSTTLTGHANLVTLGYQIGDFSINGQWQQYLGTTDRNLGKLIVDFNMKRQSPTWFETRYVSNHFRWDNDFHAATYLCFDAHYHYKFISAGFRSTTINDLIYFNQKARPAQHDGIVSINEAYSNINFKWRRFDIEGLFTLQMANNAAIVHLPLFLGKLKVGYSQPIFKKAATLQPSISIQYFTKYHADAYMPALRTFYLQDEVLIGNYPFIDIALAINVKQADIFVKYSNMFLLTGNYDAFIAPHYPMRSSKIFFGINCRLYN